MPHPLNALSRYKRKPERILVPTPIIGGKCYCPERMGLFILAEGPGILRCVACTHAGGANLTLFDGLNESGRVLFLMRGVVMGHWMIDVGFNKGLLLEMEGGYMPCMTIVWIEKLQREELQVKNKSTAFK